MCFFSCLNSVNKIVAILFICAFLQVAPCYGATISQLFRHSMVLQRDQAIPVWGWGTPGEAIEVSFRSQSHSTIVDKEGNWRVILNPETAKSTGTLKVVGKNTITCKYIIVGDVWIMMGQSNMYWEIRKSDVKKLLDDAESFSDIRYASCVQSSPQRRKDVTLYPSWQRIKQGNAKNVSAVAYAFARNIQTEIDVPIGLIRMSQGGVPIQVFMGPNAAAYDKDVQTSYTRNNSRGVLFNSQNGPATGFAIKGVVFYQGESNTKENFLYRRLLRALIDEIRLTWNRPDLPFLIIQLAATRGTNLHWVREAQSIMGHAVPGVGSIVIADNTDTSNIHPYEKLYVGKRAADWALAHVYNKEAFKNRTTSYLKNFTIEKNTILLEFTNVGSGLSTKDGKAPLGFETGDRWKKFKPATKVDIINKNTVRISNVAAPFLVRYAFSATPSINLINGGGHPISSFRTDPFSLYGTPAGSDLKRPSRVHGLKIKKKSKGQSLLIWKPSSDNIAVTAYIIYINDLPAAETEKLQIKLTLTKGDRVYVRARDAAYNISMVGETITAIP